MLTCDVFMAAAMTRIYSGLVDNENLAALIHKFTLTGFLEGHFPHPTPKQQKQHLFACHLEFKNELQ